MGAWEGVDTASSATGYPTEVRVAGRLPFGERARGGFIRPEPIERDQHLYVRTQVERGGGLA
jgi:hypothetical protein